MTTINIDASEPAEVKKAKMNQIFDPSFKLEEIYTVRTDVPAKEIRFKDAMSDILDDMTTDNAGYFSYVASYGTAGPLKGITYRFEAYFPDSKPTLFDLLRRWWTE